MQPADYFRPSVTPRCPLCAAGAATIVRDSEHLAADIEWTGRLFRAGARRLPDEMLRDTADFTQRSRAALLACGGCGSLYRHPPSTPDDRASRYIRDRYDRGYLDRMWVAFLAGYQRDHAFNAAHGIRPGARVLEVGSWFGAFLVYAAHHGAEAIGVDLSTEAAVYARQHGATVVSGPFSADALEGYGPFDAVWFLNCFEQLPNPAQAVTDAARLLVPGGHLVIRTPSADFVRLAYRLPTSAARLLLAGTNLGGVAYAACCSSRALARTLELAGFQHVDVRGRATRSIAARAFRGTPLASRRVREALYETASRAPGRVGWPWMDATGVRA